MNTPCGLFDGVSPVKFRKNGVVRCNLAGRLPPCGGRGRAFPQCGPAALDRGGTALQIYCHENPFVKRAGDFFYDPWKDFTPFLTSAVTDRKFRRRKKRRNDRIFRENAYLC